MPGRAVQPERRMGEGNVEKGSYGMSSSAVLMVMVFFFFFFCDTPQNAGSI